MTTTMSPSGATNCALTEPTSIEDSGCTLTNSVACRDVNGNVGESIFITTQTDASGAHLTGIADLTVRDRGARVLCKSTYDVDYERQ